MARKRGNTCVRCESLERKQKSKSIIYITNDLGEKIPICSVCAIEIEEEENFIKSLLEYTEEDESRSEGSDI